ncbi:MAG: substrate-binding domain-containing protein [Spirochaetia bacterium]|jgi:ABC-type tungstate transport system permease subunit
MKALVAGFIVVCAVFSASAQDRIVVAALSSLQESGFLAYVAPLLKMHAGISVEWKPAGNSQVIQLARGCEVDAIVVDSPDAEDQLMRDGVGAIKFRFMTAGPQEQFSIIALNPGACRAARFDPALRLLRWLISPEGQSAIEHFTSNGVAPYQPNAGTETCPECQAQE